MEDQAAARAEEFLERADRKDDEGILILPQDRADAVSHPDHGEFFSGDAEGFPERQAPGEEFFGHFRAEHSHRGGRALLAFGEKTPGRDVERANPAHVGGLTAQGDVTQALRFTADLSEGGSLSAHGQAALAAVFERAPVVKGQIAVFPRLENFLEVGGGEGHL